MRIYSKNKLNKRLIYKNLTVFTHFFMANLLENLAGVTRKYFENFKQFVLFCLENKIKIPINALI